MKEYTIISRRFRYGGNVRESRITGTLEYLTKYFGYTLKCGKSWEHERGNKKINLNPKTARSLVTNLNNAKTNSAANGCPSEWYELAE